MMQYVVNVSVLSLFNCSEARERWVSSHAIRKFITKCFGAASSSASTFYLGKRKKKAQQDFLQISGDIKHLY